MSVKLRAHEDDHKNFMAAVEISSLLPHSKGYLLISHFEQSYNSLEKCAGHSEFLLLYMNRMSTMLMLEFVDVDRAIPSSEHAQGWGDVTTPLAVVRPCLFAPRIAPLSRNLNPREGTGAET